MATPALNDRPGWDDLRVAAHLWQLRPGQWQTRAVRDRWLSRLPPDERALYGQFTTAPMRERYLAARVLCRATLSRYTGVDPSQWCFGVGLHGKPAVAEPVEFNSLRFNLTGTDDLVICMVTRAGEVGVDAEKITGDVDDRLVARHFLSLRAQARLASLSSPQRIQRFFEQWVLKEAYVKATGEGLAYAPERITIEQDESGEPLPVPDCQFFLWRPAPDHVAAAAVLVRGCEARVSVDWLGDASEAAGGSTFELLA
jgi:4'-phosphopantetheinyl transferase